MLTRLAANKDVLSGLIFLTIGVGVSFIAFGHGLGTAVRMGPGAFPFVAGIGLSFVALLLLGRGVVMPALDGGALSVSMAEIRTLVLVLLGPFLFALLIRPAGLVVAVCALCFVSCFAIRGYGWRPALITAAVLSAGSVLVFITMLGQPMRAFGPIFRL